MARKIRNPYWPAVCYEAMQPENLPRVLAAFGAVRYLGCMSRGKLRWWPPEYHASPKLPHGYPPHVADAFRANRRADVASTNRSIRDSPTHLIVVPGRFTPGAPFWLYGRVIAIDEAAGDGQWTSADRANRGHDLISFAMWRWNLPFAKAAYRLSRTIDFTIPLLETEA